MMAMLEAPDLRTIATGVSTHSEECAACVTYTSVAPPGGWRNACTRMLLMMGTSRQ